MGVNREESRNATTTKSTIKAGMPGSNKEIGKVSIRELGSKESSGNSIVPEKKPNSGLFMFKSDAKDKLRFDRPP